MKEYSECFLYLENITHIRNMRVCNSKRINLELIFKFKNNFLKIRTLKSYNNIKFVFEIECKDFYKNSMIFNDLIRHKKYINTMKSCKTMSITEIGISYK